MCMISIHIFPLSVKCLGLLSGLDNGYLLVQVLTSTRRMTWAGRVCMRRLQEGESHRCCSLIGSSAPPVAGMICCPDHVTISPSFLQESGVFESVAKHRCRL